MSSPGGLASFLLRPDGRLEADLSPEAIAEAFRAGTGTLWVDIDSRSDRDWALLSTVFGFHPLAIEDTRSPNSRTKVEEYHDCLFIVARELQFADWTADPYDISAANLNLFVGKRFLVSVHGEPSRAVNTVAAHVRAGPDPMERGADHLAYSVLDGLVDLYFPLLDEIDTFVDELEEIIFKGGSGGITERVFQMRRTLVGLRRHLSPMREVVGTLANRPSPFLNPDTQIYFRDVYDHVVRQLESVETYRDLLSGAMETYFTVISNRVNEIMKALSVVATVILPATLVASIYGMNIPWMPFLHDPNGFWFVMVLMVVISGALMGYLWWKRWI